jgi:hypothetical protein
MITRAKARKLVKWFDKCGDRFVKAYLSQIDAKRLMRDRYYGLKVLLFGAAFARAYAPKAYGIAAVKAVTCAEHSKKEQKLWTLFRRFCKGDVKKNFIPVSTRGIDNLEIPQIATLVREGNLRDAFEKLKLNGMGHKTRALFLRDLVLILDVESKLGKNIETHRYCQPMDVWVRIVVEKICGSRRTRVSAEQRRPYELDAQKLVAVDNLIRVCHEAGVSPLKVNAGMWYFSSNVVQDEKRLKELIGAGEIRKLDAELRLMKGFLPVRPMWG